MRRGSLPGLLLYLCAGNRFDDRLDSVEAVVSINLIGEQSGVRAFGRNDDLLRQHRPVVVVVAGRVVIKFEL